MMPSTLVGECEPLLLLLWLQLATCKDVEKYDYNLATRITCCIFGFHIYNVVQNKCANWKQENGSLQRSHIQTTSLPLENNLKLQFPRIDRSAFYPSCILYFASLDALDALYVYMLFGHLCLRLPFSGTRKGCSIILLASRSRVGVVEQWSV